MKPRGSLLTTLRLRIAALLAVFALLFLAESARAQNSGLWIGTVSLNQVTDPKGVLSEAGGKFEFRILFHVDAGGAVKLLKEVIVMQRDDDGNAATPPKVVLVTDTAMIPIYSGVVKRGGKQVGVRYSASAYDFAGAPLAATGQIAPNQTLEFTLDAVPTGPTNPFRHKFHPDHTQGRSYKRVVKVSFANSTIGNAPTAGVQRIVGSYEETLKKLVKYDIKMAGTVTLDRISTVTLLNP